MAKTKLTALKVENAKFKPDPRRPKKSRNEIPDAGKPGLYLVVQANGRKSWAVRYRRLSDRKTRKYTLPGFPSLATAHKLAQDALDQVANGHDPAADKLAAKRAPAPATVESALQQFIVGHTRTKKGRAIRETTRRENARLLGFKPDPAKPAEWLVTGKGVAARWKGRALADIGREQVRKLGDDLVKAGPVTANRTLAVLKTCFSWLVKRDLLSTSPCEGIDPPAAEDRDRERVLSNIELAVLWRAAEARALAPLRDPFGHFVQVLILTGCRRDEVREAEWAEFDMAKREWLIPGHRTKNGREHVVPITDMMAGILDSMPRITGSKLLFTTTGGTPIAGMSKGKNRLHDAMTKELGAEPERWTLHDLRRTFVTGLQRLRFSLEVAKACVNHTSGGAGGGVIGVYARHEYTDEKREALNAWERHVVSIVENRPLDNVVHFARTT